MSTLVVVRKDEYAAIASDTLTTFGDRRLSAAYNKKAHKIVKFGHSHIGVVGSAAHLMVIESVLQEFSDLTLATTIEIYEFLRTLHPILKEKYFLNPKEDESDPYESTQINALLINQHGIFGIYSLREVYEYNTFWAIGSGAEFALGAMFAIYDQLKSAEEIAKLGVRAGCEFDCKSSPPIRAHSVKLKVD
ncbi:MAG: MFS transporter [Acidobacteriota bacterium]|nr:MFS transporter [Blastocatellia bacterium]MDW8411609.1 MFS transporter [Acidobacteriota bacterium]